MRQIVTTAQFRKDLKRAKKRGKDMDKIKELMGLLVAAKPLAATYKNHPLKGDWKGYNDAHIEPDWLLIYKVEGDTLHLTRTGSHSDLFVNE